MSGTRSGRQVKQYAVPICVVFGLVALGACTELQAAGTVSDAAQNPTAGVQIAQASTKPKSPPAVSPLLQPAPEIFEASGRATWDGKRTLQGVWVAHPLAASARRVRIYNENTGTAVDGALFKRDAALEGASVLISSEAAELLGLVVGENTPLRIVAVKPVEAQPAPVELKTDAEDQTDTPIANNAVDTDEPEADAQEKADAQEEAEATADDAKEDAKEDVVEDQSIAVAVVEPQAPPKDDPAETTPTQDADEPEKNEEPKKDRVFKLEDPPKDPDPKPVQQAKAPEAKKASPLRQPYVQAGVFGVASNADKLVKRLKRKGYPAKGVKVKSGGRTLTRVLAGPFQSTAERNRAQREIRKMGMKDAVPVRR